MKTATPKKIPARRLPKTDREQAVLIGLIELYLKSGKPIGSHTLQENGFDSLSSATIRNYFGKMEEQGYLKQQHTSGGRIPTEKAFRLYADSLHSQGTVENAQEKMLLEAIDSESREIGTTLNKAAEALSEMTRCAVFISAPRFDHDFVQDVKIIPIDPHKLLSVLITDFGLIRTETIYLERPVDTPFFRSLEEYFLWRMNKGEKPLFLKESDAKTAQRIYNEIMVRHVVGYANFSHEDILRTGLSKLLAYPEFNDAAALANSLSLLEDETQMRALLQTSAKNNELTSWIGDELCPFVPPGSECAVIATPYRIHQTIAGAVALLGPMRLPYKNLFGLTQLFADCLSQTLTKSVYKHKISFRQPSHAPQVDHTSILLENKSRNPK
ncbi:MAG: heat-inducible transcription repressor HrcA [Chlamydiae bacterium RIFCSPHIGHO2_12_FULL_49_9]|nr:MAG: heat-inducible transcription repressor HrcA [Chlamydiae bacterium RIFCSPHIGHO2_12_FULL_49_9]